LSAARPADRDGEAVHNYATVRVAVGPLTGPVVCRVVSMVAARADCPVDRLDDALLLCDAIAAHAPARVPDAHVALEVAAGPETLQLRIGPLTAGGGEALIGDADVPGIGNVLERVSDELRVDHTPEGQDVLLVALQF
jgi:serine/threonine-protein kinase RsbW